MNAAWRWLQRQGGILVTPRQTLVAMAPDEGARDGTWALLAWLAATSVYALVEVTARLVALRSFDALLLGAADVAIALLAPYVATFAIELVLGRTRSHRAGTLLAPMIAVGAIGHLLIANGAWRPAGAWLPPLLAGLAALGWAFAVRASIEPRKVAT